MDRICLGRIIRFVAEIPDRPGNIPGGFIAESNLIVQRVNTVCEICITVGADPVE
jgi:hypothetical protein